MNTGSQEPADGARTEPRREDTDRPLSPRLELPDAAREILSIVGFLTADAGPLRVTPGSDTLLPWQEQALLKAMERLEVIDHYLRGRVAFFVAGKDHGYGHFGGELELAEAALAACRAVVRVVDAPLAGRTPSDAEVDTMSASAFGLQSALEALEEAES